MNYLKLFFALLLVACSSKKQDASMARRNGPVQVNAYLVSPHPMNENLEVPGSVLSAETTSVKPEVSGRLVSILFREGQQVKKGDLLVKLFDDDLKAQKEKLNIQLAIAEKTRDRYKELLTVQGISQQEYDLSTLNVENLKADIQLINISIIKTEIRAPYDGQVGLRRVSPGAYLSPSDVITTIREIYPLKIEFSVPEKYAGFMRAGMSVFARMDGDARAYSATVSANEGGVDETTRTLTVRALVQQRNTPLVPGAFVKVQILFPKNATSLAVPTQAILLSARSQQVIRLAKDSAVYLNVETGIRDSAYVQVLKGIKAGDTVITTGLMSIRPGAKLSVQKVGR